MELKGKRYVCHYILIYFCVVTRPDVSKAEDTRASDQLNVIMDKYWKWIMWKFPQMATRWNQAGDYDNNLNLYTQEHFKESKDRCQVILNELLKINHTELPAIDVDNYDVLKFELNQYIRGYKWRNYGALNPINFLRGMYRFSYPGFTRLATKEDYDVVATRLSKFPQQVDQVIGLMKQAIKLKRTNHKVSMKGVAEGIEKLIVPAEESRWYTPYRKFLPALNLTDYVREKILKQGKKIVEEEINPAYKRLKNFIEKEYIRHTRKHHGVWSLHKGREYYQECLKYYLSMDMTPKEIYDIGLEQMARIRGLMQQLMRENGFDGNLLQYFKYLETEKRKEYYNRSADALMAEFQEVVDRIEPHMNKVVRNVPDTQIRLNRVSDFGPPGTNQGSWFNVNVRKAEDRPSFTMMALTLHEAKPGHTLEWIWKYHAKLNLPVFRRTGGVGGYYSSPFNLPFYPIYSEGWAHYAEYLGEELGIYNKSALELFGRYSWEIIRACRLVVDTGIHAFRMTREEAINLMANHTAMPRFQIALEVDRYITWPGQACAYKIGELQFVKWKEAAEAKLGDVFDIRDYNEAVLNVGRAPMFVVKRAIENYIESKNHIINNSTVSAALTVSQCSIYLTAISLIFSLLFNR